MQIAKSSPVCRRSETDVGEFAQRPEFRGVTNFLWQRPKNSSEMHQGSPWDRLHKPGGTGVTGLGLSKHHPLLIGWFLLISQPRAISSVSNH